MTTKFDQLKKELADLDKMGTQLVYSMYKEQDQLDDETIKKITDSGWEFVNVRQEYQKWYTKSYRVISQIVPERKSEFEMLYKADPKRKELSYANYTISDYMISIVNGARTRGPKDAIPKMEIQSKILNAARERFKSALFDIKEILQADIYDSELETAKELNKKGFIRAAGAVAGVVLEKHLAHVCSTHQIKIKKANPSISEYNQLLKDNDITDTATWRFIQHLGDIRNLCDHHKDREPKKDEVEEYIIGIMKITKTVN
ncbi:hypothetical protein ACT7FV_002900 [Citrobacter freundii]|uniref:hypothetical protein n=1 Tax=Citrobacter TaxID=544 RepID=UPI0011DD3F73|nr:MULTISPECIES: hypothetical protein [Citrobacter]MDM3232603.1 hypothetical protein [Citrobacter sp. Cf078]